MLRTLIACCLCLGASSAWAQSAEDAQELSPEELRALEASLAQDVASVSAEPAPNPRGAPSANPDISLILNVAGAYFSDEPQLLGGHDPNRTGFTLQQLEMHVGSNVDPFFAFDANLVFAQFGVEVEEAYFTSLSLPANLQVRGGQFLTRFGRINATHPHAWMFLNQTLVNGKFFGSEGNRGLGAEISWLSPLPWFAEVVGSATEAVGECCARSYFGGDDVGIHGVEDLLYTTALKQFFELTSSWSLLWGTSAQFGPNATGLGNRTEIYGTDLFVRYRPTDATDQRAVSLQIEAMTRRRQVPGDLLVDHGGYADLAWRINTTWETAARWETATGVSNDPLDAAWTATRHRGSWQWTYYPSHFSRFRLQGFADHLGQEAMYWGVMLGAEMLVGAHGAHSY